VGKQNEQHLSALPTESQAVTQHRAKWQRSGPPQATVQIPDANATLKTQADASRQACASLPVHRR
jgi:hypothetical protein